MRLHYVMQFFPGESSAGSQQPISFATTLAARGHEVVVVSANYNIDSGAEEPEVDRPVGLGRLRVLRVPCPRGGRGGNRQRLAAYLSFMMSAGRRLRRLERPNVVIGSIQPMFAGWAALSAARRSVAPFVLEIRDLWPDALVVKGAVTPLQAKPLHWIVDRLYHESRRIVSLTPGIRTELMKKGVPPEKVDVFPNGFSPALFDAPAQSREETRERYGWGRDFVAVYTGSFQEVTAVEVFVTAALRLTGRPGIRIAMFGAGPTKEKVVAMARELGAGNVEFHDPVPKREVPAILRAADAGLMALFRSPLVHIYFENKLMDYMGAGLPILAALEGEQARLIQENGVGWVCPTFDAEELARLIVEAESDRAGGRRRGEAGSRFVRSRLLLPDILSRYADTVEAVGRGQAEAHPAWAPF